MPDVSCVERRVGPLSHLPIQAKLSCGRFVDHCIHKPLRRYFFLGLIKGPVVIVVINCCHWPRLVIVDFRNKGKQN
jgi:hypothetical protein